MAEKEPDRLWDLTLVKQFVKRAKDRVGVQGWQYLSIDMREGLIAREFAMIVTGLDRHEVPSAAMQILYRDMCNIAGLNDSHSPA